MKTKLQNIAFALFLLSLISTNSSFAQLTGGSVYTIDNTVSGAPNLFPNTNTFNSFTTAVAALNATAAGSITKTISVDVMAGQVFSESPVSVTYLNPASNNAYIVFERRGSGANPILRGTNGTGASDYTFSINGGDNYAIDGIDFTGNTANTTPTTEMEAGIALIGLASDGCNNNSISNCRIVLNQTNSNGNNGVYVVSNGDPNNNNVFTNITIQKALGGYYFSGNADIGNEIRQAGTGRSLITDIGTTNVNTPAIGVVNGVYYDGQTDFTILRTNISNLTFCGKNGYTGSISGINSGFGDDGTTTFDSDTLNGLTVVTGATDAADIIGLNFNSVGNRTILSNSLINNLNSSITDGYVYGVWDAPVLFGPDTFYIHDNVFSSIVTNANTNSEAAGLIQNGGCYAVYNNTFNTITAGKQGALNATCTAMYLASPFGTLAQLHDNKISNISAGGGTVSGIYMGSVNSPFPPIYNNEVSNVSNTNGDVIGILLSGSVFDVFNNKIHGLSSSSTDTTRVVAGLDIGEGGGFSIGTPSYHIYNNMVFDLKADAAITTSFSHSNGGNVVGISLPDLTDFGAVAQLYFNTVYLNGSAVSSSQTSSALLIPSDPTTVPGAYDIRDNIFDNKYTGGHAVSFWYADGTSNFPGIASTSNYNLLYAGTPSSNNLLFYSMGADSIQAIGAYKTAMGAREQNSISIDPAFVSPTGTIDVHIQNSSPAATAGIAIAGITRDIDGNVRPSPSATNPDIGADEVRTGCVQAIAGSLAATSNVVCSGSSGLIAVTGNSGSPIQWQSGSSANGAFTNVSGSGNTLNTPALNQTTFFRIVIGSGNCMDTTYQPLGFIVNPVSSTTFTASVNGKIVTFNSAASTGSISYYSWSFGDGNASTQPNPVHGYDTSGTHHVCLTVYDINNCSSTYCSDVTTSGNNCNAAAGIISAARDTVCSGTPANLTLTGNSVGDSIHWQVSTDNVNFTTIAGQNKSTLKNNVNQSSYFRVIVGTGGCTATSSSYPIIVPSALVSNFTNSISGKTVTFNSSTSSGNIIRYAWDFGDGTTSSESNPSHTYPSLNRDSAYYVCLTLFDGSNCSYTYCLNTDIKADGIPLVGGNDNFIVYPSPFSEYFTISSKQGSGKIEQVEVYDVLGRLALVKKPDNGGVNSLQIDGAALKASEIYYVKIKTTTGNYVAKVVKE